ncbi:signal peptide containing protein [Theileria equi strain WA]|uniref:Signal peptide containing protein n=1 Tax=Theileria equi strain WA TaxID=1537102 RepID=L1LD25_THEEQ|nr:signal peptide containing protein [Theileria equi strain WA]EKX73078.1 signal peptide containing protein [Theileria equi strain WA]|eukprot:XP_004832530.1 signal peptide containing protein [Theileria equi strain WA]
MKVAAILFSAVSVLAASAAVLDFKNPDAALGELVHGDHHNLKAVVFEAAAGADVEGFNCAGHFTWTAPAGKKVAKVNAVSQCKKDGLAVVHVALVDGEDVFLGFNGKVHEVLTHEAFVAKLKAAGCPHAHELPDDNLFNKLKESLKAAAHQSSS